MNHLRVTRYVLLGALGLLAPFGSGTVHAALIDSFFDVFVEVGGDSPGVHANMVPVSVAGFDAGLGTLNSATFSLIDGSSSGQATAGFFGQGTGTLHTAVQIELVALSLTSVSPALVHDDSCDTGQFPICTASVDWSDAPVAPPPIVHPTDPLFVDSFFDVFVELRLETTPGGLAFTNISGNARWEGRLKVTYDYTPHQIPEPSTLILMVLALTGFAVARRGSH
jgi:hypothetical protein